MGITIMNIRDLDLNLLFVFEAIYSTNNISKAAKRLDLSQPAMSNALGRLRKQIDDPLFVRDGNGVVPTLRAETMIEPVRNALAAIRQSIRPAEGFDPITSKRHFRLIVADPLEPIIMPKLLIGLTQDTQICYELLPPQSTDIEDALLHSKIDLAVFLMPDRIAELSSQALHPVDLVVLARVGHPRINGTITPQHMMQENNVALTLTPGRLANSSKVTFWQKIQQKTVCQVPKVSSITQIVATTDLIGMVPNIYAEKVAERYNLQVIRPQTPVSNQQFHMIWHKRNEVDEGIVWLRNQIESCFSQDIV